MPAPAPAARPRRRRAAVRARAAAESSGAAGEPGDSVGETLTTLGLIAVWYGLNVGFNLLNKSIFKYFPFPYTVSTVHVIVGSAYCAAVYFAGFKNLGFGRPITKDELKTIAGPATMHGLGHIAANISFAAVAISLTHTVKTLEPVFNVGLSALILGNATPLPVVGSLLPIMVGVSLAACHELSFNWLGFTSAMISNVTFGFRAVWSKKAMGTIKNLDSTALYAYTTLISMVICVPIALVMEGPKLAAGAAAAVAAVGAPKFYASLLGVGLLYHLYNQFAFNTLQRVNPVTHGVCNVVKRIVIIFSSVLFFGNVLTRQTLLGTCIALGGTALYTGLNQYYKEKKA